MNKQQSLQNIWAVTDKQAMDVMANRNYESPSTAMVHDSTDDDSDLESIDSRYGPFVAVPKEFRPPLEIHARIEHPKLSLNEKKHVLSNQNPISTPHNTSKKTVPKISHMEHPKPVPLETKRISNQSEVPLKKSLYPPQHTETLQNCQQVVSRNKANVNHKPSDEPIKKYSNKEFQKPNMIHRKVIQEHKKEIKYEYVGKREHRTVEFTFEMPSNSNLFYKDVERSFRRGPHTVSYEKNIVKWVEASNLKEEKSYAYVGKNRKFNKNPALVLCEKNSVKWVESFDVDKQNTKSNIERNPGNVRHKISYQETIVKRDSSSNPDESSSDSEYKIGWTVIPDKKTPTGKPNSKNYNHNQINKYFSKKQGAQNKLIKHHRKNNTYHKNNIIRSHFNHRNNSEPHSPRCKDTPQLYHKNDFAQNNNLKYDSSQILDSDMKNECCILPETFTQQCRISGKIMDNHRVNENLLNSEPEFTINSNQTKNTYNHESNFFPKKIDNITLKNVEDKKRTVLYYGREMCDLILGSYSSLTVFISMFNEWKKSRQDLIKHFENLEKNLKESSKKFARYKDMLDFAKTSATLAAAAIPVPHVSIAAKIISVLTGLFSVFLSSSEKKEAEVEDSNDISIAAGRDTSASTELYMHALQCGQQFEETAKVIEEFHSNVGDANIFEHDSPEMATFIHGVLEYRPRHRIFYKKLHKCFQELIRNSTSEFGKRFCEPFLLYQSEAVDVIGPVIGFLEWRFRHEDFNGESVRFELEQIERLMQSNDTEVKQFVVRIQNCIRFLQDELKFLEGCMKDISLFEKSDYYGMKTFPY